MLSRHPRTGNATTGRLNVLLVSRDRGRLSVLGAGLGAAGTLEVSHKLVANGHADPLHGVDHSVDVVVLHASALWREELTSLCGAANDSRPQLIVLGSAGNTELMRLALRAGARDFLDEACEVEELIDALNELGRERAGPAEVGSSALTAFINAKGGSGATFLACNVAHAFAALSGRQTLLIDLDLQFGTLPLYLDLNPERGLAEALANLDDLDEVALHGYVARHGSGLSVLGNAAADSVTLHEHPSAGLARLLELAALRHDRVIVDIPRHIDEASACVLERADQVVVVVQQSLTTLRDASRLLQLLHQDLGLSRRRVTVVVNRYDRRAEVTLADVSRALECDDPVLVPNDYRTVSTSINVGQPVHELARDSAITEAVLQLETRLGGASSGAIRRRGLFGRRLSTLLRASRGQP